MSEKFKNQLKDLKRNTPCAKNFNCLACDLNQLCKAEDFFGLKDYLECIKPDPSQCKFALPVGKRFVCECPIRNLIKSQLNK